MKKTQSRCLIEALAVGREKGEGRTLFVRARLMPAGSLNRGIAVAYELRVDPVALHNGSNDMLDSVGEAALSFVSHEDALAQAVSGWVGSSQEALGELAQRWEARHGHHKLQVGNLGSHVAEAMLRYIAHEDEAVRAMRSVAE